MAILAEKYAVDYTWYVDTILNLIRIAGDYVSEEVWCNCKYVVGHAWWVVAYFVAILQFINQTTIIFTDVMFY